MTKKEMIAYIKSEEERLYKELEQFEKELGVHDRYTAIKRAEWSAAYRILTEIGG